MKLKDSDDDVEKYGFEIYRHVFCIKLLVN